jgi:hypothetical protein
MVTDPARIDPLRSALDAVYSEHVTIRKTNRRLFAENNELRRRLDLLERARLEGVQLTTDGDEEPLVDSLAPQSTVIRVWCPKKTHRGREYGMLLHGNIQEVVEGEAAVAKLVACTSDGTLDAKAFWGGIVKRVDRMPPGDGVWDWVGTAKHSAQHGQWTLSAGEWKRPVEEEGVDR